MYGRLKREIGRGNIGRGERIPCTVYPVAPPPATVYAGYVYVSVYMLTVPHGSRSCGSSMYTTVVVIIIMAAYQSVTRQFIILAGESVVPIRRRLRYVNEKPFWPSGVQRRCLRSSYIPIYV